MDVSVLVEQLLALLDTTAQRQLLEQHAALLDDSFAATLKTHADQFLRADVLRSLQMADLLCYAAVLNGNPIHHALGLLAQAHARSLGGLGEYQRAVSLYDEAAALYEAHGRVVEQARAQIGKLLALANLGRYDEALACGRWASGVLQARGEWRPLARLTMNLAIVYGRRGDDLGALSLLDQAQEFHGKTGGDAAEYLAWIEQNRAVLLRNLGQFDAAIQASLMAAETLTQLGQIAEAARAQQNLAITYFVLGRYNEALALLDQARTVFLEDGRSRDAVLVELFISDCLLQVRRFPDVLAKCRQVRERFTELGTRFEVAQALLNEAVAYAGMRRLDESLASLAEARHLFSQEHNEVWVASTDLERANVLLRKGQHATSLATAQACAAVFQSHRLPLRQAHAYLLAAHAAAALGQQTQAERLVIQALALGTSHEVPALTYQCHYLLGSLAAAEGAQQAALAKYDQAIAALERLRGRLMIEFRADFLTDKHVVYEDAVGLCLDQDWPSQALEYAERAKSRALLDMLSYRIDLGVRVRAPADRAQVDELTRLRVERDRLYRRWEGREAAREEGAGSDESRQQTRSEMLALETQITELWHRLLIRNAAYAHDAALWQVRTEPAHPHLATDTVLVEYFVVRHQLIAFLVTRETVHAVRLSHDVARVQHLSRLLNLNLRSVPGSPPERAAELGVNARALLQQLHAIVIAPLAERLTPYARLIIVPHGPLHYLPFHALYDGRSFLLERYELSYLPSASVLRYCHEARSSERGLLALGHSYGGLLPYTAQEAHRVAEIFGTQASVEQQATVARLRAEAPTYRAIHLAAHGDFRPDNPLFSGLALSDGWLTTLDIFNLRLNASLVTLSACQTGRNVVGGGDELLGLMRALLYAGAASVVLSHWAVEDQSTARLMETFYQNLAQGQTKGAALRQAQLQFIAQQEHPTGTIPKQYAHPYYWAPFFLVGDAGLL